MLCYVMLCLKEKTDWTNRKGKNVGSAKLNPTKSKADAIWYFLAEKSRWIERLKNRITYTNSIMLLRYSL